MTTIPTLEKNRELHEVLGLARELHLTPDYEEDKTDAVLILHGKGARLMAPRFQPYVKKGTIQGNMGDDALRFIWDKALAADIKHEDLYPAGKEKAEAVIAAIPSRITSHDQLTTTCAAVRAKLDEAFPDVKIHHKGHGKGKWLTLQEAQLYLWVRSDGILNRAGMIIARELLCHMQAAEGLDYGRLQYPQLPAAFAE